MGEHMQRVGVRTRGGTHVGSRGEDTWGMWGAGHRTGTHIWGHTHTRNGTSGGFQPSQAVLLG